MKIWRVEIGNNYTCSIVRARNITEAIKMTLKINQPIPKNERHVSKAELIAETDN